MLLSKLSNKTILHEWHAAHHANMAPFGGYDMPLWYGSAKNEHLAVLTSACLFDTRHMAVVAIKGLDSFELLQNCLRMIFHLALVNKKSLCLLADVFTGLF